MGGRVFQGLEGVGMRVSGGGECVCVLFDVAVGWIVQADADVLRQVRGKKVSLSDVTKLMCKFVFILELLCNETGAYWG
jgi:hypothetical protein